MRLGGKRKPKTVAILGCGPAGLFAAQAVRRFGLVPDIYSKKRKSDVYGAQSLHRPIPVMSSKSDAFNVTYSMAGDVVQYLEKVYGPEIPDGVDAETYVFGGTFPVWDIRAAYSRAWQAFGPDVIDLEISPDHLTAITNEYDLVISTIPAHLLCAIPKQHSFLWQEVWAVGDAPERGTFAPISWSDNSIHYNALPAPAWYRVARINGYTTMEWPDGVMPPVENVVKVQKPVRNNCDCWGSKILRVGRYGAWDRKQKACDAYYKVVERLS